MRTEDDVDRFAGSVVDAESARVDEVDLVAEPVAGTAPARVDDVDLFAEPVTGTAPAGVDDVDRFAGSVADAEPARVDEVAQIAEPVAGTAPARVDDVDLFAEPVVDTAPTQVDDVDPFAGAVTDTAPARVDGGAPRGLTPDGSVRTTGWLQVGDHPVSSALLAALAGLLWALVGAAVLVREFPVAAGVLTLTVPVVCGVLWWLLTRWLRPASTARNVDTCRADELEPGDVVRLHGSIGPIGRVTEVVVDEDVQVVLHGGDQRTWAPGQTIHLAELLS